MFIAIFFANLFGRSEKKSYLCSRYERGSQNGTYYVFINHAYMGNYFAHVLCYPMWMLKK